MNIVVPVVKIVCPSCGGWGDSGIEEESGARLACYACGMSGWMIRVSLAERDRLAFRRHVHAEADILIAKREAEIRARCAAVDWAKVLIEEPDAYDDIPF